MNFTVMRQLPVPSPRSEAWQLLERDNFIHHAILELTYTSYRMASYASCLGYDGPPFNWDPDRRAHLRAEIDAAMMHVYGLQSDEVEHVLDSFPVLLRYETRDSGEFRTKRLILESYNRMAKEVND